MVCADVGEAVEDSNWDDLEKIHNSTAGSESYSMQAEDPYAEFIRGRGGLCIAKEVGLLYNANLYCSQSLPAYLSYSDATAGSHIELFCLLTLRPWGWRRCKVIRSIPAVTDAGLCRRH